MNELNFGIDGKTPDMRFSGVGVKYLTDYDTSPLLVVLVMFWTARFRLIPKTSLSGSPEQELAFNWKDHHPMPSMLP